MDLVILCSSRVFVELKNAHVLQVLSLEKEKHGNDFWRVCQNPSSLQAHVNYRHPLLEISQSRSLTAPEGQKENCRVCAQKKSVGRWRASPTLQLSHSSEDTEGLPASSCSFSQGCPVVGGGSRNSEPPGWLPGQQDNTLFLKEVGCLDVQREKEDAHWGVHGERWVRVKLNLS